MIVPELCAGPVRSMENAADEARLKHFECGDDRQGCRVAGLQSWGTRSVKSLSGSCDHDDLLILMIMTGRPRAEFTMPRLQRSQHSN